MTHYETIGIPPDAPHDAVQRAYRAAAKECHPDFHPGDETKAERFKALSAAWAVLGDPEARAEYDAALAKGESPGESLMDAIRRFFGRQTEAHSVNVADALTKLAEGVEDAAAAGEDAAVLVDLLREVGAGGIGALREADDDEEPEVTLARAGLLAFADFCRGGSGRSPLQEGPSPRAERRRRKKAGKR